MNENNFNKIGGIAAIFVGVSYIGVAISAIMMPPVLQAALEVSPHEFWIKLSNNPTAHLVMHCFFAISGLFGLGCVAAISNIVRDKNPGLVGWSSALAYLGFAVNTRSHFMEFAFDRKVIPSYPEANAAYQEAVQVVAGLALDIPDGFLTYGCLGIWVILVSFLALKHDLLPKALNFVGISAGITFLFGMLGYTFLIKQFLMLSFVLGSLILVPIWFIWLGVTLKARS